MTMLQTNYRRVQTFKLGGTPFIALERDCYTGDVIEIYDAALGFYGAWRSVLNFKKQAKKEGTAALLIERRVGA